MKADNMKNPAGIKVLHQIVITDDEGNKYFQSNGKLISVTHTYGDTLIDKNYLDNSRITLSYLSVFLDETTGETTAKVRLGKYWLIDLNRGE